MEDKSELIIDFIEELPVDEPRDIMKNCEKLSHTLSLSWFTNEEEKKPEDVNPTKSLIIRTIINWGIRHMVFQPLSWFEILSLHDEDMEHAGIKNARYYVLDSVRQIQDLLLQHQ